MQLPGPEPGLQSPRLLCASLVAKPPAVDVNVVRDIPKDSLQAAFIDPPCLQRLPPPPDTLFTNLVVTHYLISS